MDIVCRPGKNVLERSGNNDLLVVLCLLSICFAFHKALITQVGKVKQYITDNEGDP